MPKHHNIDLLIKKHNLRYPVYIGDTDGDSEQSAKAGIPFVFVNYGYGTTTNYDLEFSGFTELTNYFINLK